MDHLQHNREAWNRESSAGGEWSQPVSSEVIAAAKAGDWHVELTPLKSVPKRWFGDLAGKRVLCLASAGGQQAPIIAAAGAQVVSFDLSDEQLARDAEVAERDGLDLRCVRGDMADLSEFRASSFDLIVHAVSNVFVPDIEKVWRECFRVLKPNGSLLAGYLNPSFFLFDHDESIRSGKIEVKYALPYAEPESLEEARKDEIGEGGRALEFSHSLTTQIGGQTKAGFMIYDLYEDHWTDELPINAYSPSYIVTCAVKPASI